MAKKIFKRTFLLLWLILFVLSTVIISSASAEDFTIVVLPDTQKYSASYPAYFNDQTQWIVANREALNIVYVAHEGDIVDTASSTTQWANANTAMSFLENPVTTGLTDGIPYGVVPGNHDEGTDDYYEDYFGVSRFSGKGFYGEGYPAGSNKNSYTVFSASGMDFIVINLEYVSVASYALDWADGLLKTYSNRRAIVVSHSILDYPGSTPLNTPFTGWGQDIYDALKDNPNLFLMLCGHNHAEGMRTDVYNVSTVYSVLADYQDLPNGGNGWLRILRFSPANDTITVQTYSPTLDAYGSSPVMGTDTTSAQFVLSYDMVDTPPTTVTFQEGAGGYTGTQDTFLQEAAPGSITTERNCGGNGMITIQTGRESRNFGLLRFDKAFPDNGPGQIPQGAQIVSATLTWTCI